MTRKYSKNLMAGWWVKGGQAWFSAGRKRERTYRLGNVQGTRAFRLLLEETGPTSERNHWNIANLEVFFAR